MSRFLKLWEMAKGRGQCRVKLRTELDLLDVSLVTFQLGITRCFLPHRGVGSILYQLGPLALLGDMAAVSPNVRAMDGVME